MKLKKLIPLAGITGVAAVAAPLVASCSTQATEFVWVPGSAVPEITPVDRKYTISESDVEANIATMKQAAGDYFADVSKDPTLFAKELINYWNKELKDPTYNASEEFEEIAVKVSDVNKDDLTLTYSVQLKAKVPSLTKKTEDATFNISVKNLEFWVLPYYIEDKQYTMVAPLILYGIASYWTQSNAFVGGLGDLIKREIQGLLLDDSWYIDFKAQQGDQKRVIHMDRTNVWQVLPLLEEGRTMISTLVQYSTMIISTYLNITWKEGK